MVRVRVRVVVLGSWFALAGALLAACGGSADHGSTASSLGAGTGGQAGVQAEPPGPAPAGTTASVSAGRAGVGAASPPPRSAGSTGGAAAGGGPSVAAAGAPGAGSGATGGAGSAAAGAPGAGTAAAGSSSAAGAGAPATGVRMPDPKFLVPATGPCPELRAGYVQFAPDGVQRRVLLYISEAASTLDGPLIISWHSTLPNPEDATSWLGRSVIAEIEAQGGIVAAPETGTPRETRPWDNTPGGAIGTDNDQRLMDEIVACAISEVGIDVRRIHATGMSAGGLKTAQVSLRRSGYLASVVVYSGGLTDGDMPPDQDPSNLFAAMILYGGSSDISPVDGIPYTAASRDYLDLLRAGGRFGFLCDHGGGHSVPSDSQASAWQFLQDHPFGASPSPYAMGLPSGFLRYCAL